MVLKLVEASDADLAKIRKLYLEAFPAVERVPFWLLKRRAKTPLAEFCSLYDDDAWRGFIYTVKDERLVYIFFLAIDASERSKGYGSGLMTLIKERYAGIQLSVPVRHIGKIKQIRFHHSSVPFITICVFHHLIFFNGDLSHVIV